MDFCHKDAILMLKLDFFGGSSDGAARDMDSPVDQMRNRRNRHATTE